MTTAGRVPHNPDAERDVIGALLLTPAYVPDVAAVLEPDDFHIPELGRAYAAIVELHHRQELVNPATVTQELGSVNGTRQKLLRLQTACPAGAGALSYATAVRDVARRRRLQQAAKTLAATADAGTRDALDAAERQLRKVLDDVRAAPVAPAADLEEFISGEDRAYDWLIPDLVELDDRIIWTGFEGHGKSTLLRQIGVQAASGIHPFTLTEIQPVQVTLIDLENPERLLRRELRTLKAAAGDAYDKGRLRIQHRPAGLDLTTSEGRDWLRVHIAADRPQLVVAGPLYKMATGDPTDDEVARSVAFFLDELRTAHRFSLMLEAHTPYASGRASRPERPFGSSLWSRWPEFGIFLAEDGSLRHWRGPRSERAWPAKLKRGGEWPWTVEDNRTAITFAQLLEAQRSAGRRLTERELQDVTGIAKTTLHRAIAANQAQWDALLEQLDQ